MTSVHIERPPLSDADVEPCQDYEDWPQSFIADSPELVGYCYGCGWHKEDH